MLLQGTWKVLCTWSLGWFADFREVVCCRCFSGAERFVGLIFLVGDTVCCIDFSCSFELLSKRCVAASKVDEQVSLDVLRHQFPELLSDVYFPNCFLRIGDSFLDVIRVRSVHAFGYANSQVIEAFLCHSGVCEVLVFELPVSMFLYVVIVSVEALSVLEKFFLVSWLRLSHTR